MDSGIVDPSDRTKLAAGVLPGRSAINTPACGDEGKGKESQKLDQSSHQYLPTINSRKALFPSMRAFLSNTPFRTKQHVETNSAKPDSDTSGPDNAESFSSTAEAAISPVRLRPCRPERPPRSSRASTAPLTTVKGMQIFSREVEDAVVNRFGEVSNSIERALVTHLRNERVEFRPLSIQLMVLGATYDTAKPWIVVLCPKEAKRIVKRFLRSQLARTICRGSDRETCIISFETVVVGRPLHPTEGEPPDEVFVEYLPLVSAETWIPRVMVMQSGRIKHATMGGFVSIVDSQGKQALYGLTAGHVLPPNQLYDEGSDGPLDIGSDNCDDSDDSSDADSTATSSNIGGSYNDQDNISPDDHSDDREWTSLGHMSQASYSVRAQDRDWALIELDATLANVYNPPGRAQVPAYEVVRPMNERHALVRNTTMVHCSISSLPARAILPSGHSFVDVHVLQLPPDEVLPSGSSGSWVVDSNSECYHQVYGVLVADDPFGNLWIVPMVDILKDIQEELGAAQVILPNFAKSSDNLRTDEHRVRHSAEAGTSPVRTDTVSRPSDYHHSSSSIAELSAAVSAMSFSDNQRSHSRRSEPGKHPSDATPTIQPTSQFEYDASATQPTNIPQHTTTYTAGSTNRYTTRFSTTGSDSGKVEFVWYCEYCDDGPYSDWQASCALCFRERTAGAQVEEQARFDR